MTNTSFYKVIFNYLYQVKKSFKFKKFNFSILRYFLNYFSDNLGSQGAHLQRKLPWITHEAFFYLKSLKLSNFNIYEFGGGGSTLFFSSSCKFVYTVEHDETWFNEIKDLVHHFSNVSINLVKPSFSNDGIEITSFSDLRFSGMDFKEYSQSINSFPNEFFDLVVIDGRARPFCLINSISKVKSGGLILFDNANREHYQPELKKIKDWIVLESYGPTILDLSFNQTNIYRKP